MDIISISAMLAPSAFSLVGSLYLYKLHRKDDARDKEHERRKVAERIEREKRDEESRMIRNGITAVLRDRIVQAYMYYESKGYLPLKERENIYMMYVAYHDLGGNGLVTQLYNEMQELPHTKEDDKR